jgi:hypothetical protein
MSWPRTRLTELPSWDLVLPEAPSWSSSWPDQEEAHMTDELPADDYPRQWRPKERIEMDKRRQDRTEFELHVAALSDEDIRQIREAHN